MIARILASMSNPTNAEVNDIEMTNIPRKISVGPSAGLNRNFYLS